MKKELVTEKQPFGLVLPEARPMRGEGKPAAMSSKPLGADTMVGNNGLDHGPSFADKNPAAHAQACAYGDRPFSWTGMPKRDVAKHTQDQYSLDSLHGRMK